MKLKHVALDYFPDFKCLADKCNYTCCNGWNIDIKRQEYMKVKNLHTTKELSKTIKTSMTRIREQDSDYYARIKLNKEGYCPFLTQDKLCGLQMECGYNTLPSICKDFPRLYHISPIQFEKYCTIACEQVVNLLLQRPQGLRMIEVTDEKTANLNDTLLQKRLQEDPRLHFYKEIQMLFIAILQNRNYSLAHRMLLVGLAARDLDKATTKEETIAFLQKSLSLLKYSPEIETQLKKMQTDVIGGVKAALSPVLAVTYKKQSDMLFVHAMNSIAKNINLQSEQEGEKVLFHFSDEKYLQAREHFSSLQQVDSLMENIMVNTLVQRQFPLVWEKKDTSVWQNYLYLCTEYNVIKTLATAYMADKTDPADLVHIVTICGRIILHSPKICDMLVTQLQSEQKDTLAHIAMMLCC